MKTLQQQEIKAVSGGSDLGGEIDGDDGFYQRGRCQILLPTFAPQSNPIFMPIGPTTDPVHPIDEPVEPRKPKNPLPGPTTDPVNPVWTD